MFEANSEEQAFPLIWLLNDLAIAQTVCLN